MNRRLYLAALTAFLAATIPSQAEEEGHGSDSLVENQKVGISQESNEELEGIDSFTEKMDLSIQSAENAIRSAMKSGALDPSAAEKERSKLRAARMKFLDHEDTERRVKEDVGSDQAALSMLQQLSLQSQINIVDGISDEVEDGNRRFKSYKDQTKFLRDQLWQLALEDEERTAITDYLAQIGKVVKDQGIRAKMLAVKN